MTKHEAALRALEEAYQSLVPGTWMNHAEGTLRVYWPTIRDALTAQGEAEKRLAGAAKLLVCGACGERPDGPAWRWAYGDSYRNGHIVGGPVPDLCGPVVFALADPAPSAPPCECSPGDLCTCAYDCDCMERYAHEYIEGRGRRNEGWPAHSADTEVLKSIIRHMEEELNEAGVYLSGEFAELVDAAIGELT